MKFEAHYVEQHEANEFAPQMSLEDFHMNRDTLKRNFQRLFFTPPDRVPVTQLGAYALKYEASSGFLLGTFNLLEPASLLHEIEQLEGRKLDPDAARELSALGAISETKLADSKFECSDLCEFQPSVCLAFSYCADGTCTMLQVPDWPSLRRANCSGHVGKLLEDKLATQSDCSLHFWPSLAAHSQRLYTDELVDGIRRHIDGPKQSNKFQFVLSHLKSHRTKPVRLVAVELRELVDPIGDSGHQFDGRSEQAAGRESLSSAAAITSGSCWQMWLWLVALVSGCLIGLVQRSLALFRSAA